MIMIMIMNSNTNNVGGKRRSLSRRSKNPDVKATEACTCSKSLSEVVEDISLCLLKGLAKETWLKANSEQAAATRWGFKLLALLLTINVGNADLMTEKEMENFINGSSSSFDSMQCIID